MDKNELVRRYAAGERDFSKVRLRGTFLDNTDLKDINFSEADLSGVDFSGADLTGADLRGCLKSQNNCDREQYKGKLPLN